MTTVCGTHGDGNSGLTSSAANGRTSTRQRCPASSPEISPTSFPDPGNADAMARAVSASSTCRSSALVPRAEVAISVPIPASTAVTMASATSISMIVNPASRPCLECTARNNLNASRQPVDANFVARTQSRQHDRAAAGHSGRQKANGRKRRVSIAELRQYRIENHVIWYADIRPVAPERTERTGASISVEICMWRRIAALRSRESSEAVSIA